jgi:hypothetical protein
MNDSYNEIMNDRMLYVMNNLTVNELMIQAKKGKILMKE